MSMAVGPFCGECGCRVTSGGNFCERCGAPLAKPSVRSLVAFKDADLGPERGSFVSEYSDRQKALLSSNSPSEPGWFEDPLDAGWARRFDGQKWLGLQRRVLTEWEKVERATNSIEPTRPPVPPVNAVPTSPTRAITVDRPAPPPKAASPWGTNRSILIGAFGVAAGLAILGAFTALNASDVGNPIAVGKVQCTYDGAAVVQVTNNSRSVKMVYVDVGYYNASGLQLSTGSSSQHVPGGTTARLVTTKSGQYGVSTCKVVKTRFS